MLSCPDLEEDTNWWQDYCAEDLDKFHEMTPFSWEMVRAIIINIQINGPCYCCMLNSRSGIRGYSEEYTKADKYRTACPIDGPGSSGPGEPRSGLGCQYGVEHQKRK
jgi:hypothetical protein